MKLLAIISFALFSFYSYAGISKREIVIAGKVKNFTSKYIELITTNNTVKIPRRFFYKSFKPKWGKKVVVVIPSYYSLSLESKSLKKRK